MNCYVFAYGSNMCSGRLRDYGVLAIGTGRVALLDGFELSFDKQSNDGSGKATVIPTPGSFVWGVLYEITIADLAKLDDGERGYSRESTTVFVGGQPVTSWLYIATKPDASLQLRPYSWYKRFVVDGAREHGLPSEYVARLEAFEDQIDAKQERHNGRMALTCKDRVVDISL